MRDSTTSTIGFLFPHNTKKGSTGSIGVMEMLTIKAYFPKIDNEDIINLWIYLKNNDFKVENLSRLSTIEEQGFKVTQKVAEAAVNVNEFSLYKREKKEELLFDISKTTLPFRLSRGYIVKNFKSSDALCEAIKNSYFKNSGLKLIKSDDGKSAVDFENKAIFYADTKSKKELGSILRAIVLAESAKTQEKYDEALRDKEKGLILRTQIVLTTNAVLSAIGLDDEKSEVSPEFQKNYVWGKDVIDVFANINALSNAVGRVMYVSDLEACFYDEYAKQEDKKKEGVLRSSNIVDYTSLNHALDEEFSRVFADVKSRVDIAEVIRDFGGVDILKSGSSLKSLCVSPEHSDTKPSLSISNAKGVCHCLSCGFSGDSIKVVQSVKGLGFKDAVHVMAERYGVNTNYDFIKSQFNANKSKEEFVQRIMMKYKESITDKEFNSLLDMDIHKLKAFDINKAEALEREKVYEIKKIEQRSEPAKVVNSYILSSEDLNSNPKAMEYIQKTRGLKEFPPELKVLNCKHKHEDGYLSSHVLVGFINSKNGADGKYFIGDKIGHPRSVGEKALTILNSYNLEKEHCNFVLAESQWDMVALYNDPIGRKVYENSVVIILNGTSMSQEAKMFIDEHKGRYSSIVVLNQADEPNQKAMTGIVFGSCTDISHVRYDDGEVSKKADLNDLLKSGVDLASRFSTSLSNYESDVVLKKSEVYDYR